MSIPVTRTTALSGDSLLRRITVTLTDEQIKTLPTLGVDVIPAPGDGRLNVLIAAYVSLDASAGAYTNVDAEAVTPYLVNDAAGNFDQVSTWGAKIGSNWWNNAHRSFAALSPLGFVIGPDSTRLVSQDFSDQFSDWSNKPTQVWAGNAGAGNFTGGHPANTLKVTALYVVVEA